MGTYPWTTPDSKSAHSPLGVKNLSGIVQPAGSRSEIQTHRQFSLGMSLAGCFACVLAASLLMGLFSHPGCCIGGYVYWVANGALLAYLLLAPRWRWPAFLVVGFLAMYTGSALIDGHFQFETLIASVLDLCEVLIAAFLLRNRSAELPRFTDTGYLLRFLGYAVVAAPVAVGAVFTLSEVLLHRASARPTFVTWVLADGLGTAITTPALVAILQTRFKSKVEWRKSWIYPAMVVASTLAAFSQSGMPLLFLIYPLLVLTLLRFGLAWSASSLFFMAMASATLTLHGFGPFALVSGVEPFSANMLLQRFVATAMFILYCVSVAIEKQKATERKLEESVNLHTLVTQNSRDLIILADFQGRRSYVSDAAESMGGWSPADLRKQGSFDLVHPQDKPRAVAALRELMNGGDGARLEVRIRKVDAEYLWVESVLRTIRDPETGIPTGVLNIVRDISERKRSEEQLRDAYHAVEALAETDALTHLANRRRFDQYLTNEWRRSLRDHTPLSLLMIDADYFKSYNDTYGHTRGDSVLKQIAEAAQDVVTRPGDLVARFGGEEFSVILPNTSSEGAMKIAHEISEALSHRRLPHEGNPIGFLTISIGFATMEASFGKHPVNLIEIADQALYRAKNNGRNQVCNGNALWSTEDAAQEAGDLIH